MDIRAYHAAVTEMWRFLKPRLESPGRGEAWWDGTMRDAGRAAGRAHGTGAARFATRLIAAALEELQDVEGGTMEAHSIHVADGTIPEAVERLRASDGVVSVTIRDKGGRHETRIRIRQD